MFKKPWCRSLELVCNPPALLKLSTPLLTNTAAQNKRKGTNLGPLATDNFPTLAQHKKVKHTPAQPCRRGIRLTLAMYVSPFRKWILKILFRKKDLHIHRCRYWTD